MYNISHEMTDKNKSAALFSRSDTPRLLYSSGRINISKNKNNVKKDNTICDIKNF